MWICCIISCFTGVWKAIKNTFGLVWLRKVFPWDNFMLKAGSDSWQQKELNLLKSRLPVSTIKLFDQAKVEFSLSNKQLCQLHQYCTGPKFPLLWSGMANSWRGKGRFCIYLIICQMEYRLRPTSTVLCIVRGTHVEVMGRIKNLSLNLFVVLSLGLSASCQSSCLLLAFLYAKIPILHTFGVFSTPFFWISMWKYYRLCLWDTSEGEWDSPCHWIMVSACVQTQEAQADMMYMLLLVLVYFKFRGTGTWVTVSLSAPWSTKSRQKRCSAVLNYLILNFMASNNTVISLCVVFIAKEQLWMK